MGRARWSERAAPDLGSPASALTSVRRLGSRLGPLAHREEQGTFNPKVPGSRPGRPTGESPGQQPVGRCCSPEVGCCPARASTTWEAGVPGGVRQQQPASGVCGSASAVTRAARCGTSTLPSGALPPLADARLPRRARRGHHQRQRGGDRRAAWFAPDALPDVSGPVSIARRLIDDWLSRSEPR